MASLISSETETSGPQKSERVNFYCFLIYICYFVLVAASFGILVP